MARKMLRNVEKRGVQAAINVRKTLGAVEFTTKTEPTRSYAVGRFPTAAGVEMRGPGNLAYVWGNPT